MMAPVEAFLSQLQDENFLLESWPGPAGTSPKSITLCPFQRGQQDLALTSQSVPTFSGGVELILQEERENKQEDNNSLSVHSFRLECVCLRVHMSLSTVWLGLGRSTRATS